MSEKGKIVVRAMVTGGAASGGPSLTKVFVSGSILTSVVSGTCFTQTINLIVLK